MKEPLTYNEKKLNNNDAKLILASGFGCNVDELGYSQKLQRFEHNTQQNPKIKTKGVHISINFLPEDKISTESMIELSRKYMERLGFENQPYLVYQHFDANHPHLHIVTTPIKEDGSTISLHNIAKRLGEQARQDLEQEYHLIQAKGRNQQTDDESKLIQDAIYGRIPTKKAINKIVSRIAGRYKFTSLEEFNAILRQHNIIADPGAEGSIIKKNNGLLYSIVDNKGKKIGKSIKASSLMGKPTLHQFSKKFQANGFAKNAYQTAVQQKVHALLLKSFSLQQFHQNLKAQQISCYIQYDNKAHITDISFIDNHSRTVYNSREIGLSIDEIIARTNRQHQSQEQQTSHSLTALLYSPTYYTTTNFLQDQFTLLLTSHYQPDSISPEFLKRKKKKKI
ncbi:relaxase [Filimonas zeae]|uniref:Relaxase n=2 Tax=Filimonas zeae TaxID=1737353 RepID=A0A917MRZ2_9BACT|nr:relaxase [Filimonas zeae]